MAQKNQILENDTWKSGYHVEIHIDRRDVLLEFCVRLRFLLQLIGFLNRLDNNFREDEHCKY